MGILRIFYYRISVLLLLVAVVLSSCRLNEAKTPEQWFDFTWAGLAGSDALTFHGHAALQRGGENVPEETISYTGQLKEHHRELKMKTRLPARGASTRLKTMGTAGGSGIEAKLRRENGNWLLQSQENDAFLQGMARLNPLDQLEEIRSTSKKITAESGAARGTKVLRIELDPGEAKTSLKDELLSEMNLLSKGWDSKLGNVPTDRKGRLENELSSIWTAGNERLLKMLEHMEANAVYHLTIDRKSGLPARLTSETTMEYLTPAGTRQREILRTDNRFEGYK